MFVFCNFSEAQFKPENYREIQDTIYKKSHLKSSVAVIAVDAGLWAIQKYIRNDFFVDISWKSVKDNLHTGFMWDNDGFRTNMFNHPAHGSFSYNSTRYYGMNYSENIPYCLANSLIWELFLEIEPPSINDLIASTIGGLAIGEATHRIANSMNVSSSRGFYRVSKEIGSFLITPTESIQRLLTCDLWKVKQKSDVYKLIPVKFQVGTGVGYFSDKSGFSKKRSRMTIVFNADYNDPFKLHKCKPFDYFNLHTTINFFSDQPFLNKLNIEAIIYGKNIELNNDNRILLGIFQHYDYFDTDTISGSSAIVPYKISVPASYGLGVLFKSQSDDNDVFFSSGLHLNAVLIGAGLTDHYHLGKRNYNFGAGFSGKYFSSLLYKDKVKFNFDLQYFKLNTWNGIAPDIIITDENLFSIQGDKGNAFYLFVNPGMQFKLLKKLSLGIEMFYHLRKNKYFYYEDMRKSSTEFTGTLLYSF